MSPKKRLMIWIGAIIVLALASVGLISLQAHPTLPSTGGGANQKTSYKTPQDAIDYSKEENWYIQRSSAKNAIDVFVIYPTVAFDANAGTYIDLNSDLMKTGAQYFVDHSVAPVLDGLNVNLYMPKYRQMNGAEIKPGMDVDKGKAIMADVPYHDVENAFNYYLTHLNHGHQYMLLSHSQGSGLNNMLMTNYMNHYVTKETRDLMLANYMIGFGLNQEALNEMPFNASARPLDTNTIITWNTATPSEVNDPNMWRNVWLDGMIAINPLTFTTTEKHISKTENLLSILKTPGSDTLVSYSQLTGAQIVDKTGAGHTGKVIEVDDTAAETVFRSPAEIADQNAYNLGYAHGWDIALFAGNIRQNMIARAHLVDEHAAGTITIN